MARTASRDGVRVTLPYDREDMQELADVVYEAISRRVREDIKRGRKRS